MSFRSLAFVTLVAVATFAAGALSPLAPQDTNASVAPSPDDLAAQAMGRLARLRTHADPSVLPEVERLLDRSLEAQPQENFGAFLGMAALSNARHDFTASVDWARKAIDVNGFSAAPYGLLGDALYELGRVRASERAYQQMIDLRPDVGSYVRASYAAQHHGNVRAAAHALRLAIQAAPPTGEEAAFLHHQLGDVWAAARRFGRSEAENRTGMGKAPGYVPPTVGVAESYIARGRPHAALRIMEKAAQRLPSLEYIVTLGDLRWALGDLAGAREEWGRAAGRFAEYRSAGVLPDVDFIVFYADHGYRIEAAVKEARAVYADRPKPASADALAWALHAVGSDRAALRFVLEALRTTPLPDALIHFHAAAILHELGRDRPARAHARRALRIDPVFSLFHRAAAEELAAAGQVSN